MRVRWTRLALADVAAACDYLPTEDPPARRALLGRVKAAVKKLSKHPRLGRVVPERSAQGYRELILPPYRLVYEVAASEVRLLRFWHSRRELTGL